MSRFIISFITFICLIFQLQANQPDQWEEKAALKIKTFKMPEGMKAELWADASQTKNPSHFTFDSKGRMYICEIDRWRHGVDDIRQRPYMLLDDILIESSEDRMAMFRKHLDKHPMEWYTSVSDRIRLVEDRNKDGRADLSRIYADNFKDALDGPGIGIIERDGVVYYTNIPHLWKLEDRDGDGISDHRESIQDGFGIRMSFSGHDMHGLIWGPDGKLYWSIGDRGFSIKTKEGDTHHYPNEGGVFRCDPDGSNVELFCRGLRNPQELQFDDEGNLFTADNDGDNGDMERISYIVEGGDYGWHAGHQAIMSFRYKYPLRTYSYIKEKRMMTDWLLCDMSLPYNGKQPAFQLPGVGEINGGPSGFLYNSGKSLGPNFQKKYFVIHFRGSVSNTNVTMFEMKEDGAGFKTFNHQPFFKGSNVVDLELGPDGKLYMSEYNNGGWLNQDVGSIYAFYFPEHINTPENKIMGEILVSDFKNFPTERLFDLLSSDDMRVRQRSQFELAKRGEKGVETFLQAIDTEGNKYRRLHGVWGVGQMAYQNRSLLPKLIPYLNDTESSVRTQVARALGDHNYTEATDALIQALRDEHPRVAMYAAIGLGRIKAEKAHSELINLLERNNDKDMYVRHGAIMGLQGIANKNKLHAARSHQSKSVRLGVLLTLRRLKDPAISTFLNDKDEQIVSEAIRAINDVPILEAQEALAKKLDNYLPGKNFALPDNPIKELLQFRLINANFYGGKNQHAKRLIQYAANPKLSTRLRQEAIAALEAWYDQTPLDTTTGMPRPNQASRDDIKNTVNQNLKAVFKHAKGVLLAQTTRLAKKMDYPFGSEELLAQIMSPDLDGEVRLESLKILENKDPKAIQGKVPQLINDKNFGIKSYALNILVTNNTKQAVELLQQWIEKGSLVEKQWAYRKLGDIQDDQAKTILLSEFDKLLAGKLKAEVQLDLLTGARKHQDPSIKSKVETYDAKLKTLPPLQRHAASLAGGDVENGKNIFLTHGVSQCVRCHKVNGFGADVGPDLSTIGKNNSPEYLLEAIVDPNAKVAPGFGMMTMNLKSGESIAGMWMKEDKKGITLKMPDGKNKFYALDQIASKTNPVSGMPPMEMLLKPDEIRDLVAYLASLKKASKLNKKDSH